MKSNRLSEKGQNQDMKEFQEIYQLIAHAWKRPINMEAIDN
jgi:hypothetical protein